jgi:hypothetical protein
MSIHCLNCRGGGNASTVRELRDFVTKFAPAIFCILETQISKSRAEVLSNSLGYDRAFAVGSEGRSGGICILWNNDLNINILGQSKYHVDVSVEGISESTWRLTAVYGEAQTSLRHQTWDTLQNICGTSSLPWLCIGDFNEVLHAGEHEGVGHRTLTQMQGFRDTVDICNLHDLGEEGDRWFVHSS